MSTDATEAALRRAYDAYLAAWVRYLYASDYGLPSAGDHLAAAKRDVNEAEAAHRHAVRVARRVRSACISDAP